MLEDALLPRNVKVNFWFLEVPGPNELELGTTDEELTGMGIFRWNLRKQAIFHRHAPLHYTGVCLVS